MQTKIGFISLGCVKNRVDTEIMLGYLKNEGYLLTEKLDEAEIIVINTCGFVNSAKEESIQAILEAVQYKENNKCRHVLVAGCLPQRYGRELLEELPEIDGVMGTGFVSDIVVVLNKVISGKRPLEINNQGYIHNSTTPRVLTTPNYTAYLKIAEGCDNFCSYCAIPDIRGRYRSRAIEDILAEAEDLCTRGVKELIIVAQETTRYGLDIYGKIVLTELLQGLEALGDCRWIRLMYCYPTTVNKELIALMASSNKICRYIDLPLQHINNRILRLMNRSGNKEYIIDLIKKMRQTIPGLTLRTTFIVGFPGETEQEFAELLDFMKKTEFERAGVFGYSAEERTIAETMPGHISENIIAKRVDRAMRLQQGISLKKNQGMLNRQIMVLVEGWDDNAKMYYGRSEADAPEIDGKVFFASEEVEHAGNFVQVKILEASEYDLSGVRSR